MLEIDSKYKIQHGNMNDQQMCQIKHSPNSTQHCFNNPLETTAAAALTWEHKASKVSSCSVEMRYMLLKPGLQRARKRGSVECHHECDLTKLYRFQQCRIAGGVIILPGLWLKTTSKQENQDEYALPSFHAYTD